MFGMNSGYKGYSMSVRAAEAYDNGEMPISKWTKSALLDALKNEGIEDERLSKYSKKALANCFLYKSSWHHTSSKLNRTDFYSIDLDAVESFLEDSTKTYEYLNEEEAIIKSAKSNKKEEELQIVEIVYGEWEGTKRHPKLVYKYALGIQKGDWVWISPYSKKSLNGKHCEVINRYNRAPKGTAEQLNKIKKALTK